MPKIENSTFLDLTSYRSTDKTTVAEAHDLDPSEIHAAPPGLTINVALSLERANDPTELLSQDWGTRQKLLAQMEADGTLWTTFGADPAAYDTLVDRLHANGITTLGVDEGYVSSAESRTVWVSLNADDFQNLFGTELLVAGDPADPDLVFWNGDLSIPDGWNVTPDGLWVDVGLPSAVADLTDRSVELPQGWQSIGNGSTAGATETPTAISEHYKFPLVGSDLDTGTIALIETGVGAALPEESTVTFQEQLDAYRKALGFDTAGRFYVNNPGHQSYDDESGGERSLDVGVVAGAAPNSTIGLYVGSSPEGTVFTSFQSAIWDQDANPEVIASSFSDVQLPAPDSPFLDAYRELFVDAALRNQSMFVMTYDGGSGNELGNGLTNVTHQLASPYAVTVGGTSLSTVSAAANDVTLDRLVELAGEHDLGTLQQLIAGGLDVLPGNASGSAILVETVWNQYRLDGDTLTTDYTENAASSGGVDVTQDVPGYQADYGLLPTTSDPLAETGRGMPDVAALAGGNMFYLVPSADMTQFEASGGTSASTPLWASLGAQINAVFADQGLPQLGYLNDLFYTAAVVAPGSFNDVQLGNNVSSYVEGGPIKGDPSAEEQITLTPTGFGYEAGPDYDLTTGLGSPNGVLLTRALTTLAHSQLYADAPGILDDAGGSATRQSLLLQPILAGDGGIDLVASGGTVSWNASAGSPHAWTSQFAQQVLQADFDGDLVRLFDEHAQSRPYELALDQGDDLAITIGGEATGTPQAGLTNDYGFIDYVTGELDSALQVARAVAVADTAGGADDQEAVIRLRQNGKKEVSVLFYEVDDFTGRIGDLAPGDDGYDAATLGRAYATGDGDAWIEGPGFGEFLQTSITDVDAGDLIAMRLSAGDDEFFAFADANVQAGGAPATHLWNYGLNTWGWEDMKGGGDFDYNDIVVQIDFTSATGSALVA
ncbi:S8 family serine peptidase [Geminicoccus flavidas]|uniref:S8 family serine peptidase n=1 Tax=Geminicoccus flavidas TaxID=2506407 RepID=UPI00135AE5A0|nr:S8 family serine peptidase [Geminicoccus flavidas]